MAWCSSGGGCGGAEGVLADGARGVELWGVAAVARDPPLEVNEVGASSVAAGQQ